MVICKDESGQQIECPREEEDDDQGDDQFSPKKLLCCPVSFLCCFI